MTLANCKCGFWFMCFSFYVAVSRISDFLIMLGFEVVIVI